MPKPTPNPVEHSYTTTPPLLSAKTYHIAGILTTVHGLSELLSTTTTVSCLWLLHPRLQTQSCMAPFAAHIISDYNNRLSHDNTPKRGLIAVSFDQRNHGTRQVSALANEAWRAGNESHAQDMFSIYHGTAVDTSLLLDYLAAYVFPDDKIQIVQNIVLGVSLGGHAAWQCVLSEPRISAAVVVIGCPDYRRLMSDRAKLSKRATWTEGQGRGFLGSKDFPAALVEAVKRYDPAGLLWGQLKNVPEGQEAYHEVSAEDKEVLVPVMARALGNKRILNLSGGADKLVPYHCGEPFVRWLKSAIGKGGWYENGGLVFEDIIVEGAGHEVTPTMVKEMVRFVGDTVDGEQDMSHAKRGSRESRM